jgi:uncharacterized protein YqgV (UPF0045/DUF77 family)
MTEEKKFEDLTEEEVKELKIEFAPGCFDSFEGTQEELEEFIAEITRMFKSGEAQRLARPVDFDDLEEDDLEMLARINEHEEQAKGRKLQ